MDFRNRSTIYQQIADLVCQRILSQEWQVGNRVPSVRELAMELQVNPNTVMRAYAWLQKKEIIANQRGIGFFVTPESRKNTLAIKREEFIRDELPRLLQTLELLEISPDELKKLSQLADEKEGED